LYPKITSKLVADAGMITLPVKEKKNVYHNYLHH
jgi:hypothetical protein